MLRNQIAGQMLEADQLVERERNLTSAEAANLASAAGLKRRVARERATLIAAREKWEAQERGLTEARDRLAGEQQRGAAQFAHLDAKHEVLEAADAKRAADVHAVDAEALDDLCEGVREAISALASAAAAPVDAIRPAEGLLNELEAAAGALCDEAEAPAAPALRLLDALAAAINSQRAVLDARKTGVDDVAAMLAARQGLAA